MFLNFDKLKNMIISCLDSIEPKKVFLCLNIHNNGKKVILNHNEKVGETPWLEMLS